jgi:hypothetical protein
MIYHALDRASPVPDCSEEAAINRWWRSFAAVLQFPAGSCGRALILMMTGISVWKPAEER